MEEERISKAKHDTAAEAEDEQMPVTPRNEGKGNDIVAKAVSLTSLEKNSRLLLINSVTHISNELASCNEVIDRIEQHCLGVQSYCSDILQRPSQPFNAKQVACLII
jgi:hypothetical protein